MFDGTPTVKGAGFGDRTCAKTSCTDGLHTLINAGALELVRILLLPVAYLPITAVPFAIELPIDGDRTHTIHAVKTIIFPIIALYGGDLFELLGCGIGILHPPDDSEHNGREGREHHDRGARPDSAFHTLQRPGLPLFSARFLLNV